MSLRDRSFKKSYSSESDDIVNDFYIPALGEAVEYDRLAGFFSSTSLAIAAKGILGLIRNQGTMRLIVSPQLTKKDLDVLSMDEEKLREVIERKMLRHLGRLKSEFVRDHVFALGWMVANHSLDLKVAVVYGEGGTPLTYDNGHKSGIFHQKVGVLRDSHGNMLSFSGSINESAAGWLNNIEEFKVFRGWEPSEREYVESDLLKFKRFWEGSSQTVVTMDVPTAVKEKLIDLAPEKLDKIDLSRHYRRRRGRKKRIKLFPHQTAAVDSWVRHEMRGILEMATGTGKTFTALGCLQKARALHDRMVIIITCPYQHLIQQWRREIETFGIRLDEVVADSTNPGWKGELANALLDISLGHRKNLMVLTTDRTFSTKDFIAIMSEHDRRSGTPVLLIGDEVHGLGAEKTQSGLLATYTLRLGLSATPQRWFDQLGTDVLYEYFGGVVYEFTLKDAINTINPATKRTYLSPYRYVPSFISLDAEELEEYVEKTRAIVRSHNRAEEDSERERILKLLLFQRADIIKNARRKFDVLRQLLDEHGEGLKWCIIYCSPQQINTVMDVVSGRGLVVHRFTMDEGTKPDGRYGGRSERDYLLEKFADGTYQTLVAMKCLDQGVDVPPARLAIFMASSGNPREHIQRIGRVLRRFRGKNEATIYDIIVKPDFSHVPLELRDVEWEIFKRELRRYEEIAMSAINRAETIKTLYEIQERVRRG